MNAHVIMFNITWTCGGSEAISHITCIVSCFMAPTSDSVLCLHVGTSEKFGESTHSFLQISIVSDETRAHFCSRSVHRIVHCTVDLCGASEFLAFL